MLNHLQYNWERFLPYVLGIGTCIGSLLTGNYEITSLALGMAVFALTRLIVEIGAIIPVDSLLLTIGAIQWIIVPYIAYVRKISYFVMYMYVPEEEYMAVVGSSFILLSIFIYSLRHPNLVLITQEGLHKIRLILLYKRNIPYLLITISIVFDYLRPYIPVNFQFIVYLLSALKYIGSTLLLFTNSPNKWLIIMFIWGYLLLYAVLSSLYHDFMLWTTFGLFFLALERRPTLRLKLFILIVSIFSLLIVQSVKYEYRYQTWYEGYTGNRLVLFLSLAAVNITQNFSFLSKASVEGVVIRLNQGWAVTRIMSRYPNIYSHVNGETIWDAINASLVPRFLNPGKKKAGGKENFERFTGIKLQPGTSMGITLLGEGYANFGKNGTIVFLAVLGLFYGLVIRILILQSREHPLLIVWFPLIFLHVVKAETELVVVLNHLVKGLLFTSLVLWGINLLFKPNSVIKLLNRRPNERI